MFDNDKPSTKLTDLKWKPVYNYLLLLLIIMSLFHVTTQTDNSLSGLWKLSAEINVSPISITLMLIYILPYIILIVDKQIPHLKDFIHGLRSVGIEKIKAGILEIKLSSNISEMANAYQNKLEDITLSHSDSQQKINDLDGFYKKMILMQDKAYPIGHEAAMAKIDELCRYYDELRLELDRGSERTRLMSMVASTMMSLMAKISSFPVHERLLSLKGGERLSAYKYLEWKPDDSCFDLLLSRAAGILEVPFGQYHALLALRRLIVTINIDKSSREFSIQTLDWLKTIEFIGSDRKYVIENIISLLSKAESYRPS